MTATIECEIAIISRLIFFIGLMRSLQNTSIDQKSDSSS
jgi:hypothetical protein